MTAAEAIEYLQPIADNASMKHYLTALNLAIDALREKQRMEEMVPLVLKAESTSKVNQMLDELKHLKPTICTADEYVVVVDRRWISVSEQLPTTDGRFMVTIKNKGKYRTEMRNFNHVTQKWESARWVPDNIIAWQQRPEPYRPNCGAKMEG